MAARCADSSRDGWQEVAGRSDARRVCEVLRRAGIYAGSIQDDGGGGRRGSAAGLLCAIRGIRPKSSTIRKRSTGSDCVSKVRLAATAQRKHSSGFRRAVDNGRLVIRSVPRETPADESGLSAEDEIVGIGDFRVRPDQLAARLENYKPGDKVSILVSRREQLLRFEVTLGARTAEVATGSAARRDGRAKGAPRGLAENKPLPFGNNHAKGVGSGCELACLSRRKIFGRHPKKTRQGRSPDTY